MSATLEVGDYPAARAHQIVRRNREVIIPSSGCRPDHVVYPVVLQQVWVDKDTQLRGVTERGHASDRQLDT